MPINNLSFKVGNASTPKPTVKFSPKDNIIPPAEGNVDQNPAFPSPGNKVSISSDVFNTSTVLASPSTYDTDTGIVSDKPEIIALTDFIPIYEDDGVKLTKFGELLKTSQDALLISARESTKSVLDLSQFNKILEKVTSNKQTIYEFCSNFGSDINSLLFEFDTIKKKMDFRYPHDIKTLELLGFGPEEGFKPGGAPTTVEDFLKINPSIIKSWSPTKTWIQVCLLLKVLLREGMSSLNGQQSNNFEFSPPLFSNLLSNPYNIVFEDDTKNRFSYSNRSVGKMPNIFGQNSNFVSTLSEQFVNADTSDNDSPTVTDGIVSKLSKTFSDIKEFSIFNQKFFAANDSIENSIARLSYLICKEFVYSNQIPKIFPLSNYGFTINPADNNKNVWDYLIGQAGNDITDINPSPLGQGNSFISLCQSVEQGSEVLTFEDRYISDNVGTRNSGVVMTPGTFYYLESALNSTADGFDVTRISSLISKVKNCLSTAANIGTNLAFKNTPAPYESPEERSKGTSNLSDEQVVTYVSSVLSNPILLIREAERSILGEDLTVRNPGPKLWSDNKATDFSALLISYALDNNNYKLLSLLYLYVCVIRKFTKEGVEPETIKDQLAIIKNEIKNQIPILENADNLKQNQFPFEIMDKMENIDSMKKEFRILGKIANALDFVNKSIDDTDNNILGSAGAGPTGLDEELTIYSGIQRTSYITSIFLFFCLVVHAANPERIKGLASLYLSESEAGGLYYDGGNPENNPYKQNVGQFFIVEKIYNPVEGKEPESGNAVLSIDRILNNSENAIYNYNRFVFSRVSSCISFLTTLFVRFSNLKTLLESSRYSKFFATVKSLIQDPVQIKRLMTPGQMTLVSVAISDLLQRSSKDYVTPIKESIPYFEKTKNRKGIDDLFPIEDVSLVAWNLFLKKVFSKDGKYFESLGFNKKIISVGIPQQMYRRMQANASDSSAYSSRNNLVSINLYRIDTLRQELKHKPLKFLFDLKKFNTQCLANFPSVVDVLNDKKQFDNIRFYDFSSETGEVTLLDLNEIINKSQIPFNDTFSLIRNHIGSYVMEQYIRYSSGFSFSENSYNEYVNLTKIEETQFDKMMKSVIGEIPFEDLNPSVEKFFLKNSFLVNDLNSFLRKAIFPRKFDRVFHVVFDPDDFEIDVSQPNGTDQFLVDKYLQEGIIKEVQSDNQSKKFKRTDTTKSQVTLDKYFVAVETYDPNSQG